MEIKNIWLYRFTHVDNLLWLLKNGIVSAESKERASEYICVGYDSIIERRGKTPVLVEPFGHLNGYVPFYFAPRSPMMYVINRNRPDHADQSVYFVTNVAAVVDAGLPFVFTDGHALIKLSKFYNRIDDFNKIDWPIMREKIWKDTPSDGDRKRRREAEFLIPDKVPISLIKGIGVKTDQMRQKVEELLKDYPTGIKAAVCPGWYY